MLTSLLSLYIASAIQPNIAIDEIETAEPKNSIITLASFDFSKLLASDLAPIKKPEFISPIIGARSSIGVDLKTGATLYEKNQHTRLPIASITKLMTILIVLEENDLQEVVTVSSNADSTEGSSMHLRAGEEITVENLLHGALIQSANDAAVALSEFNAGSVQSFVEKMNQRATELGLVNTHFANPTGLDHPNNYSSSYDIAKLARFIYHSSFVQNSSNTKELQVSSVSGNYTHNLKSTNELLGNYLGIKGLKTGRTGNAGLCLVGIAENESGSEIVTVVLNSTDRFKETKILADWLFRAYSWPSNN